MEITIKIGSEKANEMKEKKQEMLDEILSKKFPNKLMIDHLLNSLAFSQKPS
jgi:hypothetical protein